nr:MAG: hypothetical protein [Reoviridae sp.]
MAQVSSEVDGFVSVRRIASSKIQNQESKLYDALNMDGVDKIKVGVVNVKATTLMRLPVHSDISKAATKHFGREKVDYLIIPMIIGQEGDTDVAPFGIIIPHSDVVTSSTCMDVLDTIGLKIATKTQFSQDEIVGFVREHGAIFPQIDELLKSNAEINAKLNGVGENVYHNTVATYNNQQLQAQKMDAALHNHSVVLTETNQTLNALREMVEEMRISFDKRVRSVVYSEDPALQYDVVEGETYVPSLVHQDRQVVVKDRVKSVTATSGNKQITWSEQVMLVPTNDGEVVIDKPFEINKVESAPVLKPATYADMVSINSDKKSTLLTSKRKLNVKLNTERVVHDAEVEFLEAACYAPKQHTKMCVTEGSDSVADLHVSKYEFDSNMLTSSHEGVLCYTIYVGGCKILEPVYLIGKDDRESAHVQNSNGVACDMILSRKLAMYLGFINIHTEYVAVPFIRKYVENGILPGMYTGRLGSIQRKWWGVRVNKFDEVSKLAMGLVKSGAGIVEIIESVYTSLLMILTDVIPDDIDEPKPIPSFSVMYGNKPSRKSISSVTGEVAKLIGELPDGIVNKLEKCVLGCHELKEQRHGLMYGSHVAYDSVKKEYLAPCGVGCSTIEEYYAHPCSVRARAIALQPTLPAQSSNNLKDTNLRGGTACIVCGRRYADRICALACVILCSLIPKGVAITEVREGKFVSRMNPSPVNAFGAKLTRPKTLLTRLVE